MTDLALSLDSVSKSFGDFHAVQGISLTVPRGSVYGFLGPNGAGKTTTIRMILDIIQPTSGRISILGSPSAMQVRRRIGYLPEEKGLYKRMKAWAIVAYFATLKGLDRRTAKRRAFELLERYGLHDFAEAKIEALSKGMGQKVQVLASIAHQPEFVILDEPFSGLDPANQQVMEDVIRDLARAGATVMFSTHVMSHAERVCDRIVLIAKGTRVFDGTIKEARDQVVKTVRIGTADDVEPLRRRAEVAALHAVAGEVGVGGSEYQLELTAGADHNAVVRACFELGIKLRSFEYDEPDLHDVFIHLVGDDAKEAKRR